MNIFKFYIAGLIAGLPWYGRKPDVFFITGIFYNNLLAYIICIALGFAITEYILAN